MNYLVHSKGPWAKHKYIKKIGNHYYYRKRDEDYTDTTGLGETRYRAFKPIPDQQKSIYDNEPIYDTLYEAFNYNLAKGKSVISAHYSTKWTAWREIGAKDTVISKGKELVNNLLGKKKPAKNRSRA